MKWQELQERKQYLAKTLTATADYLQKRLQMESSDVDIRIDSLSFKISGVIRQRHSLNNEHGLKRLLINFRNWIQRRKAAGMPLNRLGARSCGIMIISYCQHSCPSQDFQEEQSP